MKLTWKKPKGVIEETVTIDCGGKKLKLLIVKPENHTQSAGMLWIHGGGYMTGMAKMVYMSRAIDLVVKGGAVVVSPAYSLAPVSPYPVALRQCHAALVYMKEHADELGIHADQIMVGGESAGGGLAAALCMYAKDVGSVNIAYQMPLYPMIDCYDTKSSKDNHEKIWNTRRNHMGWSMYLRWIKNQKIPAYASPSQREDYRGLPPCYTFVGDIEPFYEETLTYIKNLKEAGVEAEVDVYPGFYHAYDMMNPDDPRVKQAADTFIEHFKDACMKYWAKQKD
jgi:acetyl esterase/lipase